MAEKEFFRTQDPHTLNGYEMCVAAGLLVTQKITKDYSVAEMYYVNGDLAAGKSTIFVSHCQSEVCTQTFTAMKDCEKNAPDAIYFLDVFSIRQNVKGDFKPTSVMYVIHKIGKTVLIAFP